MITAFHISLILRFLTIILILSSIFELAYTLQLLTHNSLHFYNILHNTLHFTCEHKQGLALPYSLLFLAEQAELQVDVVELPDEFSTGPFDDHRPPLQPHLDCSAAQQEETRSKNTNQSQNNYLLFE